MITASQPNSWEDLEEIVTAILRECGMTAQRQVTLELPRGTVDVDVLAEETVQGISFRTICECKNWKSNVPKEVVHAFRTVMQETGAHRGYIISRVGFQSGAREAALATNIDLVTFAEFQDLYFDKWLKSRLWSLENSIGNFNTYYEPIGKPGYGELDDADRAAYDAVWMKYLFAGMMLVPFSPYLRMTSEYPLPPLPFDTVALEANGAVVPDDIKSATGYREFFALLEAYAGAGLKELRQVNPITRDRPAGTITRDD